MTSQLTAVVTGVSSGIGHATARRLVEHGVRVFGSVRREADATRLAAELGLGFVPLRFDLRDEAAVERAAAQVRDMLGGRTLSGLVNNAGVAIPGPALVQPVSELRDVIETNLVGQITVTRAFAPLLGADRSLAGPPGRVIMMSSIAGKLGQPYLPAYVAAKHGLEGYSETLRRELQLFGIEVVIVGPSPVATPIWDKAKAYDGRYAGTPYAQAFDRGLHTLVAVGQDHSLSPEKVADIVWTALTATRPHARYAPSQHPLVEQYLSRLLPRRWLDGLFGAVLGLRPKRP